MKLTFADGGSIAVEVADASPRPPMPGGAGRGDLDMAPTARVVKTADEAFSGLARLAESLQTALKASQPDSFTVQFGCNFSAESGVMLAKGSVGASLQVTIVWNKA
jgi:hypothetical protein